MRSAEIFRPLETPLTAGRPAWGGIGDLPAELLGKARGRLQFISLMFAAFCAAAIALEALTGTEASRVLFGVYLVNGAASLVVYAACRYPGIDHRTVLHLGLAYEVVLCLVVSIGFPWAEYRTSGVAYGITWISILIVAFPLLIPSAPLQTLFTALMAAATAPIGLLILATAGAMDVSGRVAFLATTTPVFCVVLAYAASRVVYGLNVDVAKARELGSYRLVEKLGSGGMGNVWRAEHKMLARPAAVKLIRAESLMRSGGPEAARSRFEREAQATALLESQHSIRLYDFGVTGDGAFYYAMEFLDGLDLGRLVKEFGPVPPERAVHILAGACHSLAEAHQRGMVHRDIKPTNIYLCRKGLERDFVKVLDFGLVKGHVESGQYDQGLTGQGKIVGTPAFLAPEMALGNGQVDGRADLYALGCVGYWLLTGSHVFEADTPLQVVLHHVQTRPPRLSDHSELEIPAALDVLVNSCLAKDPAQRPGSATGLAGLLQEIDFPEPWTSERAASWWSLHRPESRPAETT